MLLFINIHAFNEAFYSWQTKINLSVLIKFSHDAKFVRRGWRWKGVWCYSPVLARLASVINSWGFQILVSNIRDVHFLQHLICSKRESEVGNCSLFCFYLAPIKFLVYLWIWILIEIVTEDKWFRWNSKMMFLQSVQGSVIQRQRQRLFPWTAY